MRRWQSGQLQYPGRVWSRSEQLLVGGRLVEAAVGGEVGAVGKMRLEGVPTVVPEEFGDGDLGGVETADAAIDAADDGGSR